MKTVTVHIDYHIDINKHYYSVPYSLIKKKLEAHITGELVTVYHQGMCVAVHPRSHKPGAHSTLDVHMPVAHRKQGEWSPERLEVWAQGIGPKTEALVTLLMQERPHPEQAYRVCLGLLALGKQYTPFRLEAACERALCTGIKRLSGIKSILQKGLDGQPLPEQQRELLTEIEHNNVRGNTYYH